jgi:hypothetical protein
MGGNSRNHAAAGDVSRQVAAPRPGPQRGYLHRSKDRPSCGLSLAVDYAHGGRVFSEEPYDLSLRDDLLNLGHG